MKQGQTRDLLIRNIPIEIYNMLEKSANDHQRSKTQEAIVALQNGLYIQSHRIQKPRPFHWGKKISSKFIENAIKEGRE